MLNFVTNYGHAWQRITASTLDFQDLMLNFVTNYGHSWQRIFSTPSIALTKNLFNSVHYADNLFNSVHYAHKKTLRLAENQRYSKILADKLKLSVATLQQLAATVQMQARLFLLDLKLMTRPMAATLL